MKTITLLLLTTLIYVVDIKAHSASFVKDHTLFPTGEIYADNLSRLQMFVGKSWKNPETAVRLSLKIDAIIQKNNKIKASFQAKLLEKGNNLSEKQKATIAYEIKDLDNRISELITSKSDIARLGNDREHIFDLSGEGRECGTHFIIKGKDNTVKIQGSCDAHFVHEIRHISLSLQSKNGLRFSKNNLLIPISPDGSFDELQGYRAQFAFKANSLPGIYPKYIEQVNLKYISEIQKMDGSYAYPSIRNKIDEFESIAKSKKKIDKDSIISSSVFVTAKQ